MTGRDALRRVALITATLAFVVTACDDGGPSGSSARPTITDGVEATPSSTGPTSAVGPDATDRPTAGPAPSTATSSGDHGGTDQSDADQPDADQPDADQPKVLGPLGSTELEIDSGEGTVQIGGGDVPAVVPDDFPLPADFEVQLASESGGQAGFSGVTALEFDELVAWYREELTDGAYRLTEERAVADSVAVLGFEGQAGSGEIAISSAPGGAGRSVLVTFAG